MYVALAQAFNHQKLFCGIVDILIQVKSKAAFKQTCTHLHTDDRWLLNTVPTCSSELVETHSHTEVGAFGVQYFAKDISTHRLGESGWTAEWVLSRQPAWHSEPQPPHSCTCLKKIWELLVMFFLLIKILMHVALWLADLSSKSWLQSALVAGLNLL